MLQRNTAAEPLRHLPHNKIAKLAHEAAAGFAGQTQAPSACIPSTHDCDRLRSQTGHPGWLDPHAMHICLGDAEALMNTSYNTQHTHQKRSTPEAHWATAV
jgi:hypothetical protein